MSAIDFWWNHLRIPLALFAAASAVVAGTDLDVAVARAIFFERPHTWVGAGQWWTIALHDGGRWLIRALVAAALLAWVLSFIEGRTQRWRRPAAYFALSVVLTIGLAGALKATTNVNCPWDLTPFGGQFPYVHLFEDRADGLRHAQCFPAAHASSGYALMCLYFMLRERSAKLARGGLGIGICTGLLFGIAQQARGAHFVSHDLCSAMLAWIVSASVYALPFRCSVWNNGVTIAGFITFAPTTQVPVRIESHPPSDCRGESARVSRHALPHA